MAAIIGMTYTEASFEKYFSWFTEGDLRDEVEVLSISITENAAASIALCDGFILTGGIDVNPSLYNGASEYANRPPKFWNERDAVEAEVYRYAMKNKLPVLGICRGLQLINVLEGGSLVQDLGEEGNIKHKKGAQDKAHDVNIVPGTLLHDIVGATTGHVNSAHHQAVDVTTVSNTLQPNAWSTDGERIIEGLEFKNKTDKPFMLCVQWHPERIPGKESNPLSQKIKEQFIAAVKNTKQ